MFVDPSGTEAETVAKLQRLLQLKENYNKYGYNAAESAEASRIRDWLRNESPLNAYALYREFAHTHMYDDTNDYESTAVLLDIAAVTTRVQYDEAVRGEGNNAWDMARHPSETAYPQAQNKIVSYDTTAGSMALFGEKYNGKPYWTSTGTYANGKVQIRRSVDSNGTGFITVYLIFSPENKLPLLHATVTKSQMNTINTEHNSPVTTLDDLTIQRP